MKRVLTAALADLLADTWDIAHERVGFATTSVAVSWFTSIPATPINATPQLEDGTADAVET